MSAFYSPPCRWAKFSAWYCPPDATRIPPQRTAFLDGEVSAAMRDETVRLGMVQEGMLVSAEPGGSCDVADFVVRNTRKKAHELPPALLLSPSLTICIFGLAI